MSPSEKSLQAVVAIRLAATAAQELSSGQARAHLAEAIAGLNALEVVLRGRIRETNRKRRQKGATADVHIPGEQQLSELPATGSPGA